MFIAGIDYSLTCPAICRFEGELGDWSIDGCDFHYLCRTAKYAKIDEYIKPDQELVGVTGYEYPAEYATTNENDCERYELISEWAYEVVQGCQGVALEGYAFAGKGKVFHIAENTGILKWKLWSEKMPCVLVEPTTVKKFAVKGNATKPQMHEAFKKETGVDLWAQITPGKKDVGNPTSDMVDAYFICKWFHDLLAEVKASQPG